MLNVTGKLHEIGELSVVNDFKKRSFVVVIEDNFMKEQYISFEAYKDNTILLEKFKKGEKVVVHYTLKGRPWVNQEGVTKYFNSLQAWKISPAE